jgi:heme-degrading monooxygenase HmoA
MAEVNYIDWHVHPFRADRWLEIWRPALDRAVALGASSCYLTRDVDDPLHFRQVSFWERRSDFEHYWYSPEVAALREAALNYFNKPILPHWASFIAEASAGDRAGEPSTARVEATP